MVNLPRSLSSQVWHEVSAVLCSGCNDSTYAPAYSLGLTTVWTGAFDEKKVSEILNLPKEHRPVVMLPVGHPNEFPVAKTRRGPKDLLHMIK